MLENDYSGQQFGAYELQHLLGHGGFSTVYLGKQMQDQSLAAIKLLHTRLDASETERFQAQAERMIQLKHPHIIQILYADVEQGVPYTAMTYAPNGTLRDRHPRGTCIPFESILDYIKQISGALQYVHNQGMVHRDIKPHNMLVGADQEVLISDFGIAMVSASVDQFYPSSQEFEGTVIYAAPEQLQGHPHRSSDQYALGVVIYEWLTGVWPFTGTFTEIASQHMFAPPPPLSKRNPAISPMLEQVVLRALEKFPHKRYPSVQEFARALEEALLQNEVDPIEQLSPTPASRRQFMNPFPFGKGKTAIKPTSPHQGTTLVTYKGHFDRIHALAWSPDGKRLASSSLDETIQVWNASNGETVATHHEQPLSVQAISWSPDGYTLAMTGDLQSDTVEFWSLTEELSTSGNSPLMARPSPQEPYSGHKDLIQAISWSPNGEMIASSGEDKTVHVWRPSTARKLYIYHGHSQSIQALGWSPDSKRVASAGEDAALQIWDATNGGHLTVCYGHTKRITTLSWSPDGKFIATASEDHHVKIWHAVSGLLTHTYQGHQELVTSVCWSPDSRLVASASLDKTIHVWEAQKGKLLFTYRNHAAPVFCVAWSPDGTRLASGGNDLTVQIWQAL